jgi:uncharacterized protein DUF3176
MSRFGFGGSQENGHKAHAIPGPLVRSWHCLTAPPTNRDIIMSSEKQDPGVTTTPVHTDTSSSTADEPQSGPPAPKTLRERITGAFGGWYYGWEVFGIVASGAAITAIALIVDHFDKKQNPLWKSPVVGFKADGTPREFTLTLNSLLSIISTFGSTCAMIPVTKGLGQLKYLWFLDKDRTLADLETFDSASRGKAGSAQLLWKLRFKYVLPWSLS